MEIEVEITKKPEGKTEVKATVDNLESFFKTEGVPQIVKYVAKKISEAALEKYKDEILKQISDEEIYGEVTNMVRVKMKKIIFGDEHGK